jgi:hypothetical protein
MLLPLRGGAQIRRFPSSDRSFVGWTAAIWLKELLPTSKLVPRFSKPGRKRWCLSCRCANLAVCRWFVLEKKARILLAATAG